MRMYSLIEKQGEPFSLEENDLSFEDSPRDYFKCKVKDYEGVEKVIVLHKVEVDFFLNLIHFQNSLGVYDETMKHLWKKFDNYLKFKLHETEGKD
jgi:hypothetical protein